MAEFKKRQSNSFWHSPLALVVLFLILIIFIYNMVDLVKKERETSLKKSQILEEIETLHKRENILNADISKLETDEGIEETIRDKYQLAKPNEKMVVIVDQNKDDKPIDDSPVSEHSFFGWLKKIFNR